MTNRAKLACLYVNKYKMMSHPTSSLHHARQSLPYMLRHRYINDEGKVKPFLLSI